MNCKSITRVDTSSLYLNNRLIARASATFVVRTCYDADLKIYTQTFCCCNRRMLKICYVVNNSGDSVLNNGVLRINISNCCYSCLGGCKDILINGIASGSSESICFNLPYPCNSHYKVVGQLLVDGVLLKKECRVI